jgi:hypothetical protein
VRVELIARKSPLGEALVRLVYGRLDPAHTPAGADDADFDDLRQLFPGF